MFDTLLIANRGEIACRIIRSARELGLKTVAVHSDADADALHVLAADTAIRIGPAPAAESYLRIDAVLDAAAATGAGAIHPGYGFLAENAAFAQACADRDIAFVGPTPAQLRLFGDKHTAREAAAAAGVPMLAGSGLLASVDEAVAAAERVGFPVMLKAVGGGGGIGMQVCRSVADLRGAFDTVTRLAASNFGAAGVFVERFVERARHVEVQLFGDGAGRVLSLLDQRAAFAAGRLDVDVTNEEFRLADHLTFLAANAASIAAFEQRQQVAFDTERDAWRAAGEFDRVVAEPTAAAAAVDVPAGATVVEAPMVAGVWRVDVTVGDTVEAGQPVLTLEAMKLEMPVAAPVSGTVLSVHVAPGDQVGPGRALAVIGGTA